MEVTMDEESNTTQVTSTESSTSSDGDSPMIPEHTYNVAERIIWYLAGTLMTLLGIRFILSLLGANTLNPFADFIYTTSKMFVRPFFSLFKYDGYVYGESRFELYTLVAMLIYFIVALGITKLVTINRI